MAMIIADYSNCYLREITELKYTSLTKIIIKEENFKWHLEAFASELVISVLKLSSPLVTMILIQQKNSIKETLLK